MKIGGMTATSKDPRTSSIHRGCFAVVMFFVLSGMSSIQTVQSYNTISPNWRLYQRLESYSYTTGISLDSRQQRKQFLTKLAIDGNNNIINDDEEDVYDSNKVRSYKSSINRRDMLLSSSLFGGIIVPVIVEHLQQPTDKILGWKLVNAAIIDDNSDDNNSDTSLPVLKTSSGLKYIDLKSGNGISPSYGNLCSVSYTAYIKLPTNSKGYSTKPQRYDHSDGYLIKHGNGRLISGIDEGLHTMKVGGTRRILIPPKLGFVDIGLGPLPELPWNRYKLNQLLDQMIELSGGTVIYEVTLLSVIPDEADLGYYSDASLTPEDFATLRENLRIKGNEGRIKEQAEEMAANTIKGQDRLL